MEPGVLTFWPEIRRFRNPGRAKAAARHAGHHGLISSSIRRLLSRSAAPGEKWSLPLKIREADLDYPADRLRSRPIRELLAPWWPACRAESFARPGSQIRRLLSRNANKSTKKPKQAPRRRLVRNYLNTTPKVLKHNERRLFGLIPSNY